MTTEAKKFRTRTRSHPQIIDHEPDPETEEDATPDYSGKNFYKNPKYNMVNGVGSGNDTLRISDPFKALKVLEEAEDNYKENSETRFKTELDELVGVEPDDIPTDPAERLRYLNRVHGPEVAKEYALRTMLKLLIRGSTLLVIGRVFNVTQQSVRRWRKELKQRMGDEVAQLDVNTLIGESLAIYTEMTQHALAELNAQVPEGKPGLKHIDRSRYIENVLSARSKVDNLVISFGVTDQKKYRPDVTGEKRVDDKTSIEAALRSAMSGDYDPDILIEGPNEKDLSSVLG